MELRFFLGRTCVPIVSVGLALALSSAPGFADEPASGADTVAFAQSPSLRMPKAPALKIRNLDPSVSERWPVPATFVVSRTDTAGAQSVVVDFSGSARLGQDFETSLSGPLEFAAGQAEATFTLSPLQDGRLESTEIAIATLRGHRSSATVRVEDATEVPTEAEATRFLIQAGFGADPATLDEVRQLGFEGWIDAQLSKPIGLTQPAITRKAQQGKPIYHTETKIALWEQVMNPRPTADPLRQRVAWSLMQIFVISQWPDALLLNSEGVANYYDMLLGGAFGNYRDLLRGVSTHPCMGIYLSHLGNRKADLVNNRFPDENYAREVMQLFSIGLWELNPDGTRVLVNGEPVPTYDNRVIGEYARVFTGWTFGGPDNNTFYWPGWEFRYPMKAYDVEHDLNPKQLLSGVVTPQHTLDAQDTGRATRIDMDLAVESLFNHPNVGPFIGRQLIQRLVTSNPSPAYIQRVAEAFADNGEGVRGDMGAVVKAVLLDPEARSYESTLQDDWGKKREPYLTLFNLAKTFDARPQSGDFESATYLYDFMLQEPFQSPSVFNFYLPNHRPSGEMTGRNLYGPEFQIMTAVTSMGTLNLAYKMIYEYLAAWGADPEDQIKLNTSDYLLKAWDGDMLVHRLARRLTDRPLSPKTSAIIRKAVNAIDTTHPNWAQERVNMAIYLIVSSPEFQIQK